MKRVFSVIFTIICLLIIAAAAATLVKCFLHRNDDHSQETLMGNNAGFEATQDQYGGLPDEAPAIMNDNPEISIYTDTAISKEESKASLKASFTGIATSITADITWYLDDEVIEEVPQQTIVDGFTMETEIELDVDSYDKTTADVRLEMTYDGNVVVGQVDVPVTLPEAETIAVVKTAEIPVDILKDTTLYDDSGMAEETADGEIEKGAACLLLDYAKQDGKIVAVRIQLEDGSSAWVKAEDAEISEDNVTTDLDYSPEQKMEFVNSIDNLTSESDYLVWVNLYTQKVNIFVTEDGSWVYMGCYTCSTGKNTSPTSIGLFKYESKVDRWDLSDGTYVEPVLVFNGNEAFTSRPFDQTTGEITDDTMGVPSSGGSIRMMEEDLAQLDELIPVGTAVSVY